MIPDLLPERTPEILVVDDTVESLRVLSDVLAKNGYDVRSMASGVLALTSIKAAQPDLILLDIKMPDLSGYEVCERLKADPQTQHIPVMFISALHEPFDKVTAFNVGGVDYITKPFQMEEVLARVKNQLNLSLSLSRINQLNAELEERVRKRTTQLEAMNQMLQQEIIERQQIEQNLRESETKFRQVSEHIQEVFWLTDLDSTQKQPVQVEYVNPAYEVVWGRKREALYQNCLEWLGGIHPADRERVQASLMRLSQGHEYDEEYRVVRPDGSTRWIRDRGFPIDYIDGQVFRAAGIAEDITERKQAELERDRFFSLSLDLLFIANYQGRFKRLNPAWQSLLGYSESVLLSQSLWDLAHPDDQKLLQQAKAQLRQGEEVNGLEIRCRRQDGSYLWVAWNVVPYPQETLIYGAGRDISQRKASEEQLIHETLHDSLTGLENRTCFMERLEIAIKKYHRQTDLSYAVMFIDLDGFKSINDTLGHQVGDQLLVQIAQILRDSVREVDSVARLGGDEFTILLEDVQNLKEVLSIVERIQERLTPSFHLSHHEIFTSASIGIVFGTEQYQDTAALVRDADIAMYRAKANGKSCYEVFNQAMYSQTLHLVELETYLRSAIANQELRLHYQPIVSLKAGTPLNGFEALLRWHHPEKGIIPASEFIPIAEDTGLINSIGEWVLQTACTQFGHWYQTYPHLQGTYLSINISGRQLREESLLRSLNRVLAETHMPATCLKLEITESSLIENTQIAAAILKSIQQHGVQISLDDFGTGFSSLRYLHQFPIDVIKIDRSFVKLIQQGQRERSIIQSIIMLARALGFATVAEGIETPEQLEQLRRLDCESGQGYLFSQPLSTQEMEALLQQNTTVMLPMT